MVLLVLIPLPSPQLRLDSGMVVAVPFRDAAEQSAAFEEATQVCHVCRLRACACVGALQSC